MSLESQNREPILEPSEFARRIGAEESAIRKQMYERNIPSFVFSEKKSAKQYVNMVAIERMAEKQADDFLSIGEA